MAIFVFLLILSIGLQVGALDLDTAFDAFLSSSSTERSYQDEAIAVKNLYKLYKQKYIRPFVSSAIENTRFAAFNETAFILLKHHQQGVKTFSVKLNKYADWTPEQLSQLAGVRVPQNRIKNTNAQPGQRLLPLDGKEVQRKSLLLPSSYDYTTRVVAGTKTPILRAVQNQGNCGSCYAFAFIALLEAQYAFQLKSGTDLSQQQMVDCSTLDHGCNGGYFTNTFQYLSKNSWQVNSALSYPYKQKAGTCAFKSVGGGGVKFGSLLYQKVAVNNAVAMQEALVTYGPLWVSLFTGDNSTATYRLIQTWFGSYHSNIFQAAGCPTSVTSTNHAVVIVGYGIDPLTNIPYWKVRNSWGPGWGEQGYFRIRRGVNMCGIESGAFYIAKPA